MPWKSDQLKAQALMIARARETNMCRRNWVVSKRIRVPVMTNTPAKMTTTLKTREEYHVVGGCLLTTMVAAFDGWDAIRKCNTGLKGRLFGEHIQMRTEILYGLTYDEQKSIIHRFDFNLDADLCLWAYDEPCLHLKCEGLCVIRFYHPGWKLKIDEFLNRTHNQALHKALQEAGKKVEMELV